MAQLLFDHNNSATGNHGAIISMVNEESGLSKSVIAEVVFHQDLVWPAAVSDIVRELRWQAEDRMRLAANPRIIPSGTRRRPIGPVTGLTRG